jgi:hypothetical protein
LLYQGWFGSDFYYPTKLGPLKKAAGAAFDGLAIRMYKKKEQTAPRRVTLESASEQAVMENDK